MKKPRSFLRGFVLVETGDQASFLPFTPAQSFLFVR